MTEAPMKSFLNVCRWLLVILLTVVLCAGLVLTAVSASIRLAFTPEAVVYTMENLNYAAVQLPDGYGGFATVLDSINDQLGYYGMELTENDLNELIRMLSVDDILTVFVQDFRSWLLEYGPVPQMDPYEMAELALSGIDPAVLNLLRMFADPTDTVAAFLSRISAIADMSERLDSLEPVRMLLSKGSLIFAASVCAALALVILLLTGMRFAPSCTAWSAAVAVSGAAMMFAPVLMNDWKNYMLISLKLPEATFNIVYLPLIESMRSIGSGIALAGLTVMIFTLVIWVFSAMIRREREIAERMKAERMNRMNGYGF